VLYINDDTQGITMPTLLTTKQIQVNNLTVSTDGESISIETNGEWTGSPIELLEIIMEVTNAD
jgi:hypothetical protein